MRYKLIYVTPKGYVKETEDFAGYSPVDCYRGLKDIAYKSLWRTNEQGDNATWEMIASIAKLNTAFRTGN